MRVKGEAVGVKERDLDSAKSVMVCRQPNVVNGFSQQLPRKVVSQKKKGFGEKLEAKFVRAALPCERGRDRWI